MTNAQTVFSKATVLIFGASGGIGSAVASAFNDEGAQIIGASRNPDSLRQVFQDRNISGTIITTDMGDLTRLRSTLDGLDKRGSLPDHVIIASGFDVRKSFLDHTRDEIDQSVSTNFLSLVEICTFFYPRFLERGSGTVTYVGGFADGSLAFPYYPINAATRSASASFLESLNRETPKNSAIRFMYFGPPAVSTASEESFLPLWKKMGVTIVSPETVAHEMLKAIRKRKKSFAMGGLVTRLGIVINALSPGLADHLFMNGYRTILETRLANTSHS